MASESGRRCLIVERHEWETGFAQEQLQIPLHAAEDFFGPGTDSRRIRVRIRGAKRHEYHCSVSKKYEKSRTRRLNGLDLVGLIGSCFVFLQETDESDIYDLWVQYDVAIVAARFSPWQQGKNSQYGRGRLVTIVPAPVEKPIKNLA